jgi:hypothetical protein
MRKRELLVVLASLAVLVAAGVVVLWPRGEPDRITQANFDRIHEGMTRAEVETLLGPPGDHRTEPAEYSRLAYIARQRAQSDREAARLAGRVLRDLAGQRARSIGDDYPAASHWWEGNTSLVMVSYNHSDRVTDFARADALNPKPSAVQTLLWRLKRQWHRWFPE